MGHDDREAEDVMRELYERELACPAEEKPMSDTPQEVKVSRQVIEQAIEALDEANSQIVLDRILDEGDSPVRLNTQRMVLAALSALREVVRS
jgi:hypothetical protein